MNQDPLDEIIKAKLGMLDTIHPPDLPGADALWQSLIARRASRKSMKQKVAWRVAAAILVVALAGYQFFEINIAGQAIVNNHALRTVESPKERAALEYIARHCAEKSVSCDAPVVRELRRDLEHSFDKLEEIDRQLLLYGDDPTLIRARTRIESHQARVIKAIVQTL